MSSFAKKSAISYNIRMPNKKLRVGIFSFTADEGCVIVFTEILNDYLIKWQDLVDIVYCRQLKNNNDDSNLDIAIVEGAIATEKELNRIKQVRNNSKKVIAIGSCAINGSPSNQRNHFSPEIMAEIDPLLHQWNHLLKIMSIKEVIPVDAEVAGCPMDEKAFVEVFEGIIASLQ
jgi:coenzyme F420-reducing hydrogenase gamma subunit